MLKNYWYVGCESVALRRQPLSATILGCPIVIFRGKDGGAAALEDRCKHRNAPLSAGTCKEGRIRCPYHGWEYHSDGAIHEIPALGSATGSTNISPVQRYRCMEVEGYVWICLADTPALENPPKLPFWNQTGWNSFRMKTRFNNTVEACLENFLDCPHAAFVHAGWFRSHSKKTVKTVVRTLEDGAEAEYFEEPRRRSLVWQFLSSQSAKMQHIDRFIAPSSSRVSYVFDNGMKYYITSFCTPLSDTETEVYTTITFRVKWVGWFIKLYFKPLSRKIIGQDVKILNLQSSNIRSFGAPEFRVTKADLLFYHIRDWRQALASGNQPPVKGIEKTIDVIL